MLNERVKTFGLALLSIALYGYMSFFISRHETAPLLATYCFLFIFYCLVIFQKSPDMRFWIYASVGFRLVFLFSVPALSDDFYRFIWDGRLLDAGIHPFAETPAYYIKNNIAGSFDLSLYQKLNSKEYFTIYPPLSQYIFLLSAKLSPQNVYGCLMVLKAIIFSCELGTLVLITKLLKRFDLPDKKILVYALNPLVIIELTGNAHFEGIMIFLLLASLWLLMADRLTLSAIVYSLSVAIKILPLIFLPLFIKQVGWKKALSYFGIIGLTILLLSAPLADVDIISGFSKSIGYYFKRFEFNASIYYMIRGLGYWFYGYNIISSAGWMLGLLATLLILYMALLWHDPETGIIDQNLFLYMMWCMLIFFLFTTTLHPWYIITLLTLSVFTRFYFVTIWTGFIFLTYAGYDKDGFTENLWLVALEYIMILGYLIYELRWKRSTTY